jgi:hypothetical protein
LLLCSGIVFGEETFITSSILASDKDGTKQTSVFNSDLYTVYWKGTAKNVSIFRNKASAEWYSPNGNLYLKQEFAFDKTTKSATISLNLGNTPWNRVLVGQWVLKIIREGYEGISESFTVEPTLGPEEFKNLYTNLLSNYQKYYIECSGQVLNEHATLKVTEITKFKNENYIYSSFSYQYDFNDTRTNPNSRASTVVIGPLLKAIKSMYKNFGDSSDIQGYILEISYSHYNFVTESDPVLEVTKIIVKSSEVKKYNDLETTAQDLVKAAIVIVNNERIELTLQPL